MTPIPQVPNSTCLIHLRPCTEPIPTPCKPTQQAMGAPGKSGRAVAEALVRSATAGGGKTRAARPRLGNSPKPAVCKHHCAPSHLIARPTRVAPTSLPTTKPPPPPPLHPGRHQSNAPFRPSTSAQLDFLLRQLSHFRPEEEDEDDDDWAEYGDWDAYVDGSHRRDDPLEAYRDRFSRMAPGTEITIDLTGYDANEAETASEASESSPPRAPAAVNPAPAPPPSGLAALGLDRKQMEQERLARLATKRKASDVEGPAGSAANKRAQRQESPRRSRSPRPRFPSDRPILLPGPVGPPPPAAESSPALARAEAPALPFPKGVVKKTWAFGQPRLGDDIKIEEVLQKAKLELAVLSSFVWDWDWALSKLDVRRTKMVLICHARDPVEVA